jgi:hypothetical protein
MKNLIIIAVSLLSFTFCSSKKEKKAEIISEDQIVKNITEDLDNTSKEVQTETKEKLAEIDTLLESL